MSAFKLYTSYHIKIYTYNNYTLIERTKSQDLITCYKNLPITFNLLLREDNIMYLFTPQYSQITLYTYQI